MRIDDPAAIREDNPEDAGDEFDGQILHGGVVLAGIAWDLKRGGPSHDVRNAAARRSMQEQIASSAAVWWAPECKTFSRARGKPVPGATHWPPALRSREHPYGLPILNQARRATDREKVDVGNELAKITFMDASAARAAGKIVTIENPTNSYIWDLAEARALAAEPGMQKIEFTNCMFRGGQRNKKTTLLTNSVEIVEEFRDKMCAGRAACDRTGRPHLTWAPAVVEGRITSYVTDGESEYPTGMCDAVGRALARRLAADMATQTETIMFTEIFAGPRAVLSARVARHLAVARAAL